MAIEEFRMPDLGEGLPDGQIVRWLVAVGDDVALNQPIVEIETAKAVVEVPSPYAGTVAALHHPAGSTVDVGTPIIGVEVRGVDVEGVEVGAGTERVLVGYGPREPAVSRRVVSAKAPGVLAKPPVRKLARDLGVDLGALRGSGPQGTISRDDVRVASGQSSNGTAGSGTGSRRIPAGSVRRATARAMVASAFTAPHVTEFLSVDATATVDLRDRLSGMPEFDGVRVTSLALVARALLVAVRRNPMINASWDDDAGEIVLHDGVNLGIAVATPRGLVVPNVPDADRLALPDLARALQDLVETARTGRTTPESMRGGTITITNIGSLGVDTGTPILNPGEAAILGLGSIRPMPWVHDGALAVRTVAQLALSFDHRLVDGGLGSAVLSDVGRLLTDPALALAWT